MKEMTIEGDKPTVLIVDDVQEILSFFRSSLECYFDILHTDTTKKALFFCTQLKIDVILTDLNFELTDSETGFDLITNLEDIGFNGKIAIMSGYLFSLTDKERSIVDKADKIFVKPFSIEDFFYWVKSIASKEQNHPAV